METSRVTSLTTTSCSETRTAHACTGDESSLVGLQKCRGNIENQNSQICFCFHPCLSQQQGITAHGLSTRLGVIPHALYVHTWRTHLDMLLAAADTADTVLGAGFEKELHTISVSLSFLKLFELLLFFRLCDMVFWWDTYLYIREGRQIFIFQPNSCLWLLLLLWNCEDHFWKRWCKAGVSSSGGL